jgi:hypothetical protein
MYDAITASNIPAGAELLAGYGDGLYNDFAAERARFPGAIVVQIAVFARDNLGVVLDVENGDATPAEAPGWVVMRRKAGVDPTVYCNASTWPAVRAAFRAAGVAEPHYWIAAYDGDPTIPAGAIAKQWRDAGPYDQSAVADYWPGVDSEVDMPLTQADVDLILNTKLGSSGPTVGAALQSIASDVWNHTEVDAATGKPIRMGAIMGWADRMRNLQSDGINGNIGAVSAKVDALEKQMAALTATGGPSAAQIQAAVQAGAKAAVQELLAELGKDLAAGAAGA